MCSKPPSVPPPPPPPQATKAPDNVDLKKRNRNQTGAGFMSPGSTLLTGPSGVGAVSTGRNTLLGG